MAVKSYTTKSGSVWIPILTTPKAKIVIVADNGTSYTVMNTYSGLASANYTIGGSFTKSLGEKIGSFDFQLVNDNGRFLNKFNGGEVVKIYLDYTDATTLLMYGKIDNVRYGINTTNGFYLEINGREYPEIVDKLITGIKASTPSDVAIAEILYTEFSDITLTFWTGTAWAKATYNDEDETVDWDIPVPTFPSSSLINMTYQHKKGLTVINEITERVNLDSYLEYSEADAKWYMRTFIKDSIKNYNAGIAYGVNMLDLSDYGEETDNIYNRVTVYGKSESDNIILLSTKNNSASQTNYWIKDNVINNSDLVTMKDVEDKATFELNDGVSQKYTGRTVCICQPNLRPGDNITMSVPYCNISGLHRVHSYTHEFGDFFKTTVEISKKNINIVDLFVPQANPEDFMGAINNSNSMKNAYTVYFDEDPSVMIHNGTLENNGELQLQSDKTTGYAESLIKTMDEDVTECEFRRYENYNTVTDVYEVTNNNGVTWEQYDTGSGKTHLFSYPGNKIGFKITLNRASTTAPTPAYRSVCMLTK